MHTHTHTRTRAHTHTSARAHTHARVPHTHTRTRTHTHTQPVPHLALPHGLPPHPPNPWVHELHGVHSLGRPPCLVARRCRQVRLLQGQWLHDHGKWLCTGPRRMLLCHTCGITTPVCCRLYVPLVVACCSKWRRGQIRSSGWRGRMMETCSQEGVRCGDSPAHVRVVVAGDGVGQRCVQGHDEP